jgi:hypothetical protein
MAEARAKLKEEAEEEERFTKGLGSCSFGVGSDPASVDAKKGKISRIRPLRYDWRRHAEAFDPWKIEVKALTEQWRKEYNQCILIALCTIGRLRLRPECRQY